MNLPPAADGIINSHIVAGLLGSLVGLKWAPGSSWLERVANVGVGFGCAIYVTPAAAEWVSITSPRALAGLSFAAGMFGLSLAASVSEGIKATKAGDIITSWLTRR